MADSYPAVAIPLDGGGLINRAGDHQMRLST